MNNKNDSSPLNHDDVIRASIQALINDQAYLYALLMKRTHQDEAMIPVTQEIFEKWQSEWKKETAHNIRLLLQGLTGEDPDELFGEMEHGQY